VVGKAPVIYRREGCVLFAAVPYGRTLPTSLLMICFHGTCVTAGLMHKQIGDCQ
jgi:hypothetical protein